ncbi:MAG TPA: bifunctional phosphoribosyl-AMP cyclohydrolase/phosphoribosyl-ATP diphosphatase HisIE [Ignavibacteriaceae bacterium]|nr:bifunctional phosphoribosyl-AMP cyclohydrolase/phosphoribosyl-ATP diphosphatase HisIE [Ignavibacteriaceae bacterium]
MDKINLPELNFEKLNGLIPAIVVDKSSDKVLMLGFMNKTALEKTIETKLVTFFSRTRNELWTKGESSGNFLHLIEIKPDCDNDTLLIYAVPDGNTCHTGNYSCFGIEKDSQLHFLNELFDLIKKRKIEQPENSYTTSLFNSGTNRIIQKVGEEAIETVIAAKNRDKNEIINETSDLIYHLFVMLAEQEIDFEEIVKNLKKRHNK